MILDLDDYRALVGGAPAMVWRTGVDGRITEASAALLAFTGHTDVVGHAYVDLVHPDDAARCAALTARRAPFTATHRLRRADGGFANVLARGGPRLDDAGAFAGLVGECLAVDGVDGGDALVGASEFFEMSLDCVCVAGLDGWFRQVNASWTRTLGWTRAELLARPSIELVHPDDRPGVLAGRDRLRSGAPLAGLVNRYLCKDGTYRWFEWRSIAHLERGVVYAAARDITEQRAAAERLRESEERERALQRQIIASDRLASVGRLAAGVGHEINNPLAVIISSIVLVSEGLEALPDTEELREMTADVQVSAERIKSIVRSLTAMSRSAEETTRPLDLHALLDLAADITRSEVRSRAKLLKRYGAVPRVDVDEPKMVQVFTNLLVNAAHAIEPGRAEDNEIVITTTTDDAGRAVVDVCDTGQGMAPDVAERVFEPFFTTKPLGSGKGLGLSISHSIVTSMGGSIRVASTGAAGTTFRVTLPASRAAP